MEQYQITNQGSKLQQNRDKYRITTKKQVKQYIAEAAQPQLANVTDPKESQKIQNQRTVIHSCDVY